MLQVKCIEVFGLTSAGFGDKLDKKKTKGAFVIRLIYISNACLASKFSCDLRVNITRDSI